jgi:hypothetical protein
MPVTVPGIMGAVLPNLVSVAMIGTGTPKYSKGVALGVSYWIPKVKVNTVDVGTAGAGKNVPLPLVVPPQLLYANILVGMTANGLAGILMPVFALGLANGLAMAFAQMLVSTNHPTVGVGAGVAKFSGPPAYSSILQGFKDAGMDGDKLPKKAKALGMALDVTFASLLLPVAIVGPPSISPGGGSGFGSII